MTPHPPLARSNLLADISPAGEGFFGSSSTAARSNLLADISPTGEGFLTPHPPLRSEFDAAKPKMRDAIAVDDMHHMDALIHLSISFFSKPFVSL